jgi:glycosyltransferase involved in cell wall biosynthesis
VTPALFLNGKFAAQRTTGVQRVAEQLLRALDAEVPVGHWTLLCPPQARPPALQRIAVRVVGPAGLPLHLWEQAVLPWAARGGCLVNLAGTAPALARRQVAMLHDAAVFDHPQAYTRAFVAWYRWLHRRLARQALALFTVSAFSRQQLAVALALPPARFTVLHNGAGHLEGIRADETVLDRFGLRGQTFVLAVGSANPTKNLTRLMAAWQVVQPAGVRLVLVGGSNTQVFAGADAALPAGVLRTGPLGDAPLAALYRHAIGLVFPSIYEGFGLPPLEAMASGCPVAVARAASLPEVCGDAALYFDPLDPADIAAALQRLLHEPALRAQLRTAGLARAAGFCWADAAAGLRATLRAQGLPA